MCWLCYSTWIVGLGLVVIRWNLKLIFRLVIGIGFKLISWHSRSLGRTTRCLAHTNCTQSIHITHFLLYALRRHFIHVWDISTWVFPFSATLNLYCVTFGRQIFYWLPCRFRYLITKDLRLKATDGIVGLTIRILPASFKRSKYANNPHLTYKKFIARW